MTRRIAAIASIFTALVMGAGTSSAQIFSLQPKTLDEVEAAQQAAKEAAEFEHLGALARLCLLPPSRSEDLSDRIPLYVSDPSKAPARSTWYGDPARIFDNFYFLGGKVHSSWALKTSEGLIVFDTMYPYNSEELVVGGLRKLGLDPKDIKYLVISHAHQDHIGGAELIQTRFGSRVVMSGPDWDLVEKLPNRFKTMAPKRDIVATDGMKITLGEASVSLWFTPGHTDGTQSFTFQVRDNGRPVNVVYSGGTALVYEWTLPEWSIKNLSTYIASQRHLAAKAKETGASVLISNHSEFDSAFNKSRMLAGRGDGPHPFENGADWVQRYFKVTENCARATQLKLERMGPPLR